MDFQRNINYYKQNNNELLLNNVIQDDFLKYLKPFNLLHILYLSPKYQIRNNFITPNGWIANSFALLGVFFGVLSFLLRFLRLDSNAPFLSYNSDAASMFQANRFVDLILNGSGYIISFISNYRNSLKNVSLVLTIQNGTKYLRNNEAVNLAMGRNIMFTIFVIVFYLSHCFTVQVIVIDINIDDLFKDLLALSLNVTFLYLIRIIIMIKCNLLSWLHNFKRQKSELNSEDLKGMFLIYLNLLESYHVFVKVFEDMILFFIMTSFLHTMMLIEIWIVVYGFNYDDSELMNTTTKTFLLFSEWIFQKLLLIAVLVQELENVYIIVEEIQGVAARYLGSQEGSVWERRLYKNVMRLHRAYFRRAKARGMINLDALLPLQLISLITTYTIVLLQFAFN